MQRLEEFFRLSGEAYHKNEMAKCGGMWTILAKQEADTLERAIGDIEDKERTGDGSEDRGRRLIRLVKRWIEPGRWAELFPGAS